MVAIVSPAPPKGPREPRLEGTAERAGHGHCPDLEGQWGGRSGGGQGGRWGWTWEKLPTRPAQGVPEASLAGQDAVVVTWEGWALGLPPTCSSAPPAVCPAAGRPTSPHLAFLPCEALTWEGVGRNPAARQAWQSGEDLLVCVTSLFLVKSAGAWRAFCHVIGAAVKLHAHSTRRLSPRHDAPPHCWEPRAGRARPSLLLAEHGRASGTVSPVRKL